MRRRTAWALGLALAAATLAGCSPPSDVARGSDRLQVVATTTQLEDLVRSVGGARVQVTGILPPNVDPHDFSPTPRAALAVARARVVVESGLGIDAWADRLVASSGAHPRVLVASHGLPIRRGDAAEPAGDPHWWHDPTLFERAAEAVARELGRADPSGRAVYRRNARRYVARLVRMDARNRALVACVPRSERKLVTNHDAFGYLAAHYGLRVVGSVIPSLSTAAQASASNVAQLVERIRSQHVRAVFTEASSNPELEQQVAREAGVAVRSDLYGDALGPRGSPGATYLGMERWNVHAIVSGLLGHAPPPGGC